MNVQNKEETLLCYYGIFAAPFGVLRIEKLMFVINTEVASIKQSMFTYFVYGIILENFYISYSFLDKVLDFKIVSR